MMGSPYHYYHWDPGALFPRGPQNFMTPVQLSLGIGPPLLGPRSNNPRLSGPLPGWLDLWQTTQQLSESIAQGIHQLQACSRARGPRDEATIKPLIPGADPGPPSAGVLNWIIACKARAKIFDHAHFYETTPTFFTAKEVNSQRSLWNSTFSTYKQVFS